MRIRLDKKSWICFSLAVAQVLIDVFSFSLQAEYGRYPFISSDAVTRHGFRQSDFLQIHQNGTLFNVLNQLQVQQVPISRTLCSDGHVGITYSAWPPKTSDIDSNKSYPTSTTTRTLVVLLHGFDLSCLEFRRLGPLLASDGYHVVAPDLLGWGFSQVERVSRFTANVKTEILSSFLSHFASDAFQAKNVTINVCLIGASLGAASSLDLLSYLEQVSRSNANSNNIQFKIKCAVWISPQVFLDATALKFIPEWYARFLIKLLKIPFLRRIVNSMSVHDKNWYYGAGEGDDVLSLWTLQSKRPGWEEAQFSFMKSGGYAPSLRLSQIKNLPSLIIGGKDDGVLGNHYTKALSRYLENSQLQWIADCGHFPHEEKPEETARAIQTFLSTALAPEKETKQESTRSSEA